MLIMNISCLFFKVKDLLKPSIYLPEAYKKGGKDGDKTLLSDIVKAIHIFSRVIVAVLNTVVHAAQFI